MLPVYQRICVLLVFSYSISANARNDYDFAGNVKTMRSITYNYSISDSSTMKMDSVNAPGRNSFREFDKNGNVIKSFYYDPDGSARNYDYYKYDKDNQEVYRKEFNPEGKTFGKGVKKYVAGHIVSEYWESVLTIIQRKYSYNDKGQLIEMHQTWIGKDVFGGRDSTIERTGYEYDNKGNVIKEMLLGRSGDDPKQTLVYGYDDLNQKVTESKFDINNDLWYIKHFMYDQKGRMVEERHFLKEDSLKYSVQWEYNDQDDCISRKAVQPDGRVTQQWKYSYAYDEWGNWTAERQYLDGHAYGTTYRTLEYY
jgi:hypothetical protein